MQEQKPKNLTETSSRGKIEEKPDKNPDGTFAKGRAKTGGREAGTRDFATDFDEVVDEIAKENKLTKSEVRKILLKRAYAEAKQGNFPFWRDIADRYYGKAPEKIRVETEDTEKNSEDIKELTKKLNDLYGSTSGRSDGMVARPLGDKAQNKE